MGNSRKKHIRVELYMNVEGKDIGGVFKKCVR